MPNRFATVLLTLLCGSWAMAHDFRPALQPAGFYRLVTTPLAVEGLTGDRFGNLYTPGRNAGVGVPCPVWRISFASVTPVVVGLLPTASPAVQCSPAGLAFGPDGRLFVGEGD